MKKYQQKKILDLLETLAEAHGELQRMLSLSSEKDGFINLLADCKNCAVKLGEYIEGIEGKGTHTVELFERYHELLCQLSIEATTTNLKALKRHLIQVENSVKSELKPNRIEVAFLSYKVSMWDSLESIYLAAKDDPQCDVYVIPIPYYDKKADGNFGLMHYEADLYPDAIPITDWREYDIETRHPDIIFIHSPYDEGNYVTSVHPNFYSKRIREFTDLLCYVPYFVVANDVKAHNCTTAGCIYAHKVIIQSEKVRETYVKVYSEFAKKYGIEKLYGKAENKFLALGSPKFDKIFSANLENITLPEQWKRLINGRKVILYATTIGTILADTEGFIKKLEFNLKVFEEQSEFAIWFRPHPLSEATLQSMRPMYAVKYRRLVEEYRSKGYGIFDDTDDVSRAIIISDAFYGQLGSLYTLYGLTGKPMIAQLNNVLQSVPECEWVLRTVDDNLSKGLDFFLFGIPEQMTQGGLFGFLKDWFHNGKTVLENQREAFLKSAMGTVEHSGKAIYDYCSESVRNG